MNTLVGKRIQIMSDACIVRGTVSRVDGSNVHLTNAQQMSQYSRSGHQGPWAVGSMAVKVTNRRQIKVIS